MTTDLSAIATNLPVAPEGENVTHVIFILDRSGSMHGKEADVIGGFNAYVEDLRSEPGLAGVSYVRFDNVVELVWNDVALPDVPAMTADLYEPRGNTALLDAVGMTVTSVQDIPDHAYVVIIHTDGLENASREWKAAKVKDLIQERTARGNWTFSFFGCELDAWGDADAMGIGAGNRSRYAAADVDLTWKGASRASNMMRKGNLKSSARFNEAAEAAKCGASDAEVERILRDDKN